MDSKYDTIVFDVIGYLRQIKTLCGDSDSLFETIADAIIEDIDNSCVRSHITDEQIMTLFEKISALKWSEGGPKWSEEDGDYRNSKAYNSVINAIEIFPKLEEE